MPTLNGFLDITEIVDNKIYDMKINKCDSYLINDVLHVVRLPRGISDTMFQCSFSITSRLISLDKYKYNEIVHFVL